MIMAAATQGAAVVKEVPWVDAWVRWERNDATDEENLKVDDNDKNEEEELPSPTESYTFTYPNPNNDGNNDIVIELKGFHEDSEQIWNSTGLKLWQSSAVLCQHLVNVEAMMLHKIQLIIQTYEC